MSKYIVEDYGDLRSNWAAAVRLWRCNMFFLERTDTSRCFERDRKWSEERNISKRVSDGRAPKSWSLCGRSVQGRAWPGAVVPWPSGSPRFPAMTSQRWGPRLRVVDTCAWKCSSPSRLALTVTDGTAVTTCNRGCRVSAVCLFLGSKNLKVKPFPHELQSGCWMWWRWRLRGRSLARRLWTDRNPQGP